MGEFSEMSILLQQEKVYVGDELDNYYKEKALTRRQRFIRYLVRFYDDIVLGLYK